MEDINKNVRGNLSVTVQITRKTVQHDPIKSCSSIQSYKFINL